MKARRKARSLALQALYEIDSVSHPAERVIAERLEDSDLGMEMAGSARQIILGVLEPPADLDIQIARHAPEWPLDQMAVIDRNILRIAIWEFAVDCATP